MKAPSLPGASENRKKRRMWMKTGAWVLASVMAIILLATAGLSILFSSSGVHNYLIATIQKKASETLGVQVQLQNFSLHPFALSLDIYGLVVHGADPYSNPPILQLDHASVGIRVLSLLRRRWYLDQVTLDHPVIQVFTDSNGLTNIPKPKSSGTTHSSTNLFDLGVRNATLVRGEFFYNDRKVVLDADIHNADFRSSFDPILSKYSGKMRYENGHLQSGSFNSIPHNLEVSFDATRTTFYLRNARLTSGSSQLSLDGIAENYGSPIVQANYNAVVDAGEFKSILKNPSIPSGLIHAKGSLQYRSDPKRPAIETIVLTGVLDSDELRIRTPRLTTQVQKIAAQYSLSNGNAVVHDFHARVLGGELSGMGGMNDLAGDSHSTVHATLRRASVAALKGLASSSPATRDINIVGFLNADAEASWGKSIDDLVAKTDATLQGTVSRVGTGRALPVDGAVHGTYNGRDKAVSLQKSFFRLPQSTLTLNGMIGNNSSLAVDLVSNDLGELDTLATLASSSAQPLGLTGVGSFKGLVQGSTSAPHLTGQVEASGLKVRGSAWRALRARVDVSPSFARVQDAVLDPASRGSIRLNASTELTRWKFTESSPVQADLSASQIEVADLAKIANVQMPVVGTLAGNVKIHGTKLNPTGTGDIIVTKAKIQDETIQSAKLTFVSASSEVHTNLSVKMTAGEIDGVAVIHPHLQTYDAELRADGFRLERLQTLKVSGMETVGSLSLKVTGHGTFKDPQVSATIQIPQLVIQKQTITGLSLQADIANHVMNATLKSKAINTSVEAKARVDLSGDYLADASLDTQAIPLQPLAAVYAPAQAAQLSGQTELHATLHGPLQNRSRLEAHLTIPILKVNYSNTIQLAAVSPIHADFINNVLTIQHSSIQGTDTNLEFQGSIPTIGNAPASLLLKGAVNLSIAQLFIPDVRSSGQLRFDINSYGARTDPNVQGQVEVVDATFANGDLPVGLEHGNGVLTLTKDRLNITSFEGTVGGGKLTAQGGIAYRPSLQFNMGLAARGVRLLYPLGMREGVDADLALSGTPDDASLGGQVRLTDVSFTPQFDLANFIGQISGGAATPPAQGFTQNLRLNVGVTSASGINLVSRTLSLGGTANLRVQGTAAQPVILGRINLSNGDLILNGDRFVLEGGTIQFVNPAQTQPVVNVALNTTIQEYNIHLRFKGPVDQLRTDYASDPALPAADIINLLAFGKTNEAGLADPATPANQAAETAIASQVSSQVTSRLSKIAGISQLSIDPVLGGGQTNPGARITIQQRVTGNLYVTFSSDVTDTQKQVITGQYRLSPRVSVSATRDQNGGFAFDTQIKKSW